MITGVSAITSSSTTSIVIGSAIVSVIIRIVNVIIRIDSTPVAQNDVTSAGFSPDGQRIVTGSWDKTAKVWDTNGNLLATLPAQREANKRHQR